MIRLITKRGPLGDPQAWEDYATVQIDEITPRQGMRFERELVALLVEGIDLGVTRWAEAVFKIQNFRAESLRKITELIGNDDPEEAAVALVMGGRTFTEWAIAHPAYVLSEKVSVWAALNGGGRTTTLSEVFDMLERDIEEIEDPVDFLPEPEGKG